MQGTKNQLSRYGAVARDIPFTTGKFIFLVSATEVAFNDFQDRYPTDGDGVARVTTTWAAAISIVQAATGACTIFVSPQYTTVPTQAQINILNNLQVSVIQAAQLTPEGSYITANLNPVNQATTTSDAVFQVNGRIKLYGVLGQVTSTLGATTNNAQVQIVPTIGSTTSLCATATTTGITTSTQLIVNSGTLSSALVVTTQGAFSETLQGSPIIVQGGTIKIVKAATTTGSIAWTINYAPVDPGAFVYPLQ